MSSNEDVSGVNTPSEICYTEQWWYPAHRLTGSAYV